MSENTWVYFEDRSQAMTLVDYRSRKVDDGKTAEEAGWKVAHVLHPDGSQTADVPARRASAPKEEKPAAAVAEKPADKAPAPPTKDAA